MKHLVVALLVATGLFISQNSLMGQEKAPQKVIDLANGELSALGMDPIIVAAVKEQNAKGLTLDEIKKKDEEWMATAGVADYMKALMESECGKHLSEIQKSQPYYAEIFVTDNQGANVAMTDKTSDYWQGDEDKFTKAFNNGQGAIYVSDVKFDDSTQNYLAQVSVPVKDGDKAIGTITIGINIDELK